MSETNYFRLIEAYFDGSIKPEQKVMLESKIQTDPLLKAEFDLQKNIINGIGTIRKQQLKARLSAIEVGGSGNFLLGSGAKWLAGTIATVTIFSSLLYFSLSDYATPEQLQIELSDVISQEQDYSIPEMPKASDQTVVDRSKKENEIKITEAKVSKVINESNTAAQSISKAEEEAARVKPQELVTFQDETQFQTFESKPYSKASDGEINKSAMKEVQIEFHEALELEEKYYYKYYNNKLYLYGDFKNEPYEIIEWHNQSKKQLFLSYQGNIYAIKDNIISHTPLQKVEDDMLILELELIMNQKK